jgi:hypothetical protein
MTATHTRSVKVAIILAASIYFGGIIGFWVSLPSGASVVTYDAGVPDGGTTQLAVEPEMRFAGSKAIAVDYRASRRFQPGAPVEQKR